MEEKPFLLDEKKGAWSVAKAGDPLLQGTSRLWRCHHITGQPTRDTSLRSQPKFPVVFFSSL